MKKKVLSLCLVIALVAIAAVSGMLAYFTDTDSQHNTMTIGNVKIEQVEKQFVYGEDGTVTGLEEFVQDKDLLPATTDPTWGQTLVWSEIDSELDFANETAGQKIFVEDMNTVDKVVTVTNTGANDIWFRTIVLAEDYVDGDMDIHVVDNATAYTQKTVYPFTYKDSQYAILVYTYNTTLESGKTATPCFSQVALNKASTQEYAAQYGDQLDIYCFSQAVQAKGFDTADEALNAAFGEPNAANVLTWATEFFGA